jgi:hypothetical protein
MFIFPTHLNRVRLALVNLNPATNCSAVVSRGMTGGKNREQPLVNHINRIKKSVDHRLMRAGKRLDSGRGRKQATAVIMVPAA